MLLPLRLLMIDDTFFYESLGPLRQFFPDQVYDVMDVHQNHSFSFFFFRIRICYSMKTTVCQEVILLLIMKDCQPVLSEKV